jgi:hypothetical protein
MTTMVIDTRIAAPADVCFDLARDVDALSLRSIASRLEVELQRLDSQRAAEAEDLLDRLARDPAVVAVGGHAVLVLQARR